MTVTEFAEASVLHDVAEVEVAFGSGKVVGRDGSAGRQGGGTRCSGRKLLGARRNGIQDEHRHVKSKNSRNGPAIGCGISPRRHHRPVSLWNNSVGHRDLLLVQNLLY